MRSVIFLIFLLSTLVYGCGNFTVCLDCLKNIGCSWCASSQNCVSEGCEGFKKDINTSCPGVVCKNIALGECLNYVGCAKTDKECFEIIPELCPNPNVDPLFGYWKQLDMTVGWCERKRDMDSWEPYNTLSALLMTVIALFYLAVSSILNNGTMILMLYSFVALNGIASALGHALSWMPFTIADAQTMVIPIAIASAGMVDEILEFAFGGFGCTKVRILRALGIIVSTIGTSIALPALQARAYMIFVITFGAGTLFIVVFQLVYFIKIAPLNRPLDRHDHTKLRNVCIVSAFILLLALICWVADSIVCAYEAFPPVLHLFWHLFAVVALCNFINIFSYQYANNCGHDAKIFWLGFIPFVQWKEKVKTRKSVRLY